MLLTINDTNFNIDEPSCKAIVDSGRTATQLSFSTIDKKLINILSIYFKDEMIVNNGEIIGTFEFESYSNKRYNLKSFNCTVRL